jgi:hypothetical protein
MERWVVEEVRFERYEDFRRWVADQPGYWVLVRGVPMPSPSPPRKHQEVSLRFEILGGDQLVTDGRSPRLYSMTNHRVTASWKANDLEKDSVFRT